MANAPTAIIYDGKRLIPAPRLQFNRNHRRSSDQSIIGTEHQVTLTGQLVGCKGWDFGAPGDPIKFYEGSEYPADDTICNKFGNLVEMQDNLRDMFSVDGDYKWFEVIGCDGLIRKWRARTISIDFSEGSWTDIAPYSIVLGLQTDNIDDDDLHIDHNETWDVQWDEENGGIYTLSHTLSCQSEEFINESSSDGWNQAKAWIDDRLAGADYTGSAPSNIKNAIINSGFGISIDGTYSAYNYGVQRSLDEYGGTYSVSETWTLSKEEVFSTWSIVTNDPRDDYKTVSLEGEFRSFLDRTDSLTSSPANKDAAIEAFDAWVTADGPYTAANARYSLDKCEKDTLGACPINKSVTVTTENEGGAFGEATRVVQFSFEYSDSDAETETVITNSVNISNVDNCETRVNVNVQIQGHECECGDSKIGRARLAYADLDCEAQAALVYTGSGELTKVSSTYVENEVTGTVEATCEFSDKFVEGFVKEERISTSWTCGDLQTGGTKKQTFSVDGTIKGVCTGEMPTAPATTSFNCFSGEYCNLRRTNIVQDTINKVVNYTYEYDDESGPGLVEVTVETTQGPENCSNKLTTVNLSVQGNGCDSNTMLENAVAAMASINADTYAPSGSCRTSFRENVNRTRGNVQQTYMYTQECDASLNVTTTDMFDINRCGDTGDHSVEGEIKGACFVDGGAMAAAEKLYLDHVPTEYADGSCLVSSRVARNDKNGTINFSYEFRTFAGGYEHEQTISTKADDSDCCTGVTLSGTIIPCCPDSGQKGQVAAGEAGWAAILTTLENEAKTYCTDTLLLRSTNVTRNRKNGQIQYSYTYICCNSNIDGVIKESVNISREFPSAVVAIIPILGRTCGPIVQDKGTKSVEKCSVSIALTFPADCSSYAKPAGLEASVQGIINAAGVCSDAYGTYMERDTESWNPRTGQYTRNVSFICECC